MKKTNLLCLTIFLFLFLLKSGKSQDNHSYTLTVKDIHLITVNQIDDAVEFSIYLKNTTTTPPLDFVFATAQYFFTFNTAIASGDLVYTKIASGLPPGCQPPSTTIGLPGLPNVLGLSANLPLGCENSPTITPTPFGVNGTLIETMRLRRTSGTFNLQNIDLLWKNNTPGQFTKIYIYDNDCLEAIELTNPDSHFMESNLFLPVELSSFTSNVNRNIVSLNWSTMSETNNSGFDIERKLISSEEWLKISNIAGNGSSKEVKSYSFSESINTGKYNYRLKQIDFNGNFKYYNLSNEVEVGIPNKYSISQNYPNPFNPSTKIDFELPYDGKVNILVYDLSGREIVSLVNEVKTAGYYTLQFNADNLASGIYFYRISARNYIVSKKMMIVK
jgi:hypothetical protein